MRNSDADAAVYWLARMFEAGEDPLYVARRIVRFASEDVGNADPRALEITLAAKDAVHFLGMPEANTALAQGERENEEFDFFSRFSFPAYAVGINGTDQSGPPSANRLVERNERSSVPA